MYVSCNACVFLRMRVLTVMRHNDDAIQCYAASVQDFILRKLVCACACVVVCVRVCVCVCVCVYVCVCNDVIIHIVYGRLP